MLVPLSIIQLFLLAFGVALILSTMYVKFRDISHIWEVVLQILMYAIPIIYPITMVSNSHLLIAKIMMLNPIAQAIQDIRHNLIAPETTVTTWDLVNNFWVSIIPILLTFVIVAIGSWYFSRNSKKFAEII